MYSEDSNGNVMKLSGTDYMPPRYDYKQPEVINLDTERLMYVHSLKMGVFRMEKAQEDFGFFIGLKEQINEMQNACTPR